MLRENFGKGSRVIVDRCRLHGVWFDAEELAGVLSWVRRGGEDRVRAEAAIAERGARFDQALERARPRRYDETPRPGDLSDALWLRIWEALFAGR
jgi:Zn-finger nucleic acid-binding protein